MGTNAQVVVKLSDGTKQVPLGRSLEILKDPENKLTLAEVRSGKYDSAFKRSQVDVPAYGYGHLGFWLRFTVDNQSKDPDYYLEVSNLFIKYIQVYAIDEDGANYTLQEGGSIRRFSERPLAYRSFIFPLKLTPGSKHQVYVHTYEAGPNSFPLTLHKPLSFIEGAHRSDLFLGIYFGILLIMIVYNLFVYFSLREKSYLFYVLYIVCFIIAQFCSTGYSMEYLWGDYPNLNIFALRFFQIASLFWAIRFAQDFLGTKQNLKLWHKLGYIPYAIIAVYMLLLATEIVFFLTGNPLESQVNSIVLQIPVVLLIIVPVYVLTTSIIQVVKGYRPARFYLLAWVFLIIGAVLYQLKNGGVIPSNAITQNGLFFGSALEVMLLSLALADKIAIIKEERAKAQARAIEALQANEKLIAEQNKILEIKVAERTAEVVAQKAEIEEKNADITDSIRYAKRIQESILPAKEAIREALPESFILYKPRDIVSGDFYWFNTRDEKAIIAAVDCTGHGVPGAFMSVVGNTLLSQIVTESVDLKPGPILDELNHRVIDTLRQNQLHGPEGESKDGMEVALCILDRKKREVHFSGANRPLFYYREDALHIIVGDKFPIGGGQFAAQERYEEHSLYFNPGDMIYICTDGYVDQFGGENRRKFMSKRFRELLEEIHDRSMEDQQRLLDEAIMAWQGNYDQTDDILVMGIRF